MQNIFYELIKEAANGKIIIDKEEWPIGFNTTIFKDEKEITYNNESNLSTLIIRNEAKFFELLTEYIMLELEFDRKSPRFVFEEEKNHIKLIIAYLFVNATTEDFLNPENLIKRNINFLKDQTFNELNNSVYLNGHFFDSEIEIKNIKHSITMETPYKIDISLVKYDKDKKLEYQLPSIAYGIDDKTCYIYSLINPKSKKEKTLEELQYEKKIKRELYKLNSGVSKFESSEFFEYKENNTDFYPENITDVTPSHLLSLIVFLSLLQKKEIENIKCVPYLPLRYLSRDITANNIEDSEKRIYLQNRNDLIQDNVTNKFIRTFNRAAHHIRELQVLSYPYEVDEFLSFKLTNENHVLNNEILNDVAKSIREETTLKR